MLRRCTKFHRQESRCTDFILRNYFHMELISCYAGAQNSAGKNQEVLNSFLEIISIWICFHATQVHKIPQARIKMY